MVNNKIILFRLTWCIKRQCRENTHVKIFEDMYTPLYEGAEENSDKDEGDEKQIYFTTS